MIQVLIEPLPERADDLALIRLALPDDARGELGWALEAERVAAEWRREVRWAGNVVRVRVVAAG